MLKLTIGVMMSNQLNDTKAVWGSFLHTIDDKQNVELLVIDNGSTDGSKEWVERFIFPHFPDHRMIRNEENLGTIKGLNQIWKESKGDVVATVHNDLIIYDKGWDNRVKDLFERHPKCGLAGFFGAEGMGGDGGRISCHCNFLEAELHATRDSGEKRVLMFDGISLIWRKEMMDQVGGFDQGYIWHHRYDLDISLTSHYAGWENWFLGVAVHHMNGLTANRPDSQIAADKVMGTTNYTGDNTAYTINNARFLEKWKGKIPLIIP
jgi:GT2 family glycosyltransferase